MQTIEGFAGRQLAAGDIGYDEARALFNGMIDGRPALIAQCASPDDVARAVAHALHNETPLAVRAGGHSVAGTSTNDDGVVVDVRPLAEITVDPRARTVRCGTGITWSELDRATQEHGLATTGGRGLHDGRRGADPRRRLRLARAAPRARVRQPDRGRPRHRHGRAGARERRREPGAALGAARWRRQLRRGDCAGVPPSSARADGLRRPGDLRPGRRSNAAAGDARLLPGCARRGRPRVHVHDCTAGAVHPGRVARSPRRDDRGHVDRLDGRR